MKKSWIILFFVLMALGAKAQHDRSYKKAPGVVVAHAPKTAGRYLGTPSIAILPNGDYLMSFDFFGPGCTSDIVHVYRSSDKGATWKFLAELADTFWAGLFIVGKDVYMLGVRGSDRNLSVRKSADFGKTWSAHFILRAGRFHGSSTPVVFHNGRVYKGYEHLGIEEKGKPWMSGNRTFIMSASVTSDLTDPQSWVYTNELVKPAGIDGTGWLETNAVLGKDGTMKGVTRLANESGLLAGYYTLKSDTAIAPSSVRAIPFIGGATKFNIMWDARTQKYWALTNYPPEVLRQPKMRAGGMRSVLSLISSDDLLSWKINAIVLASEDVTYQGFQYVDWKFENNDIVFISRTACPDESGAADNAHNANYMTFHRIKNYAKARTPKKFAYLLNNR